MSEESPATDNPTVSGVDNADNGAIDKTQTQDAPATGEPEKSSDSEDSGAKGPASPLEAVKAALGEKPAADSPPQGDKPSPAADAKGEAKTLSPEEQAAADKALPFHNHPRWKEVTTARQAAEAAVAEMTPKAQRMDALEAKFRETGLSNEDINPLFEGGAQLKRHGSTPEETANLMKVGVALKLGDRQVLRQIAEPVLAALGLQLVEVLPPEIQKMVDEGAISEDAGRKMAGLEFNVRAEAARRGVVERVVESRDAVEAATQRDAAFERAAAGWESRVKAGDADWSRKEPFIVEGIRAQLRLRNPTSAKEVEDICQAAYDQVTRIMQSTGGQRPAVRPAGGGSTSTVKAVPKSPLDAAKLALGMG